MTKPRSSSTNDVQAPPEEPLVGLLVRGVVKRRWRKTLETGTEVVFYDVSGTTIQQYHPNGDYFALGEAIEIPVNVSCYQSKNGVRYSLVRPGVAEGEF